MKSIFAGVRDIILWSYERGTWQYDLLCLLIISAIFLVPSKFFGDRDRETVKAVKVAQANDGSSSAAESAETVHEVALGDLQNFLQKQNRPELQSNSPQALAFYLRDKLNRDVTILNIESLTNPQGHPVGYRVRIK